MVTIHQTSRIRSGVVSSVALAALFAVPAMGCQLSDMPDTGYESSALTDGLLGASGGFAVLAGSTVTSTGATIVHGDLGVSPGTAVTGFGPGVIDGSKHSADTAAQLAQVDLIDAYNYLAGEPATALLTGQNLGGKTLTPGVYRFTTSAQLNGVLTLDGQGDPDAMFVFQMGSTLTVANGAAVIVVGNANPCNVFWQVGSSATLGSTAAFQGNIVAMASITIVTGATLTGRALARAGAVTMDTNAVSLASCGLAL